MSEISSGLLQFAYFVYARSESPGEVMHGCRLIRAFATCRCNKNHHLVCCPIYSTTLVLLKFHCGPISFLIQNDNLNS